MNTFTKRGEIAGPAGVLSVAVDTTTDLPQRGLAVLCHPHPRNITQEVLWKQLADASSDKAPT